jgi:hypothetical protein
MKKLALPLLCACALSGCALLKAEPWPKAGSGGLAEFMPITDDQVEALSERLELLRRRDAGTFAASDFAEAETKLTRIRRELAGELFADGNQDMESLEALIASIERKLARGASSKGQMG